LLRLAHTFKRQFPIAWKRVETSGVKVSAVMESEIAVKPSILLSCG
jgi:hypothetical protein